MKITCEQLEGILERQDALELAALEEHARDCAACALQLKLEREISAAAPGLQKEWPSPYLWPRIERALDAEGQKKGGVLAFPVTRMAQWRLAAAAAVLLVVTVSSIGIIWTQPPSKPTTPRALLDQNQRLLTEQALGEVEKAETAYVQSIERLAALAAPRMKAADTPLLSNYREKLLVLDSAIAEIRAQADGNRYNATLRKELLAVYQAKQQTLLQLVQEEIR